MESVQDETTPQISAQRAEIYRQVAAEILRIDVQNVGRSNQGLLLQLQETIERELGRDCRTFARKSARKLSLLREATEESYGVRIKNPMHLYDFLRERLPKYKQLGNASKPERERASKLCQRISEKLVNGHAGVWI